MKKGKREEYWTNDPYEWLKAVDWLEMQLENLYGLVMNHPNMPRLRHNTNGYRTVHEISFEEYVKIAEPRMNRILNQLAENLMQDIAVRSRAYSDNHR